MEQNINRYVKKCNWSLDMWNQYGISILFKEIQMKIKTAYKLSSTKLLKTNV